MTESTFFMVSSLMVSARRLGPPRSCKQLLLSTYFLLSTLYCLLSSTFVPLRDHRNRPHLRGVGDFVALGVLRASRQDEERLLVLPAERTGDHTSRRRDHAECLAVGRDDLDAGARRHVDVAFRVDRAAVAAARRELDVLALVGERSVGLYVERRERRAVGHVEHLLVGAERHAVRGQVLAVPGDLSTRIGVEEAAHREVRAALAVGDDVVDHAADAVERFALIRVGKDLPLRCELLDALVQTAFDDEHAVTLGADRECAARVRVAVGDRRLALAVQFDHRAVVVLREQKTVIRRDDAVAVVAGLLPHERPLHACADHSGNRGRRDVLLALGRRGTPSAAAIAARSAAAARRRRRLAHSCQRSVAGIDGRLYRRCGRVGWCRRQSRRLAEHERRARNGHCDSQKAFRSHHVPPGWPPTSYIVNFGIWSSGNPAIWSFGHWAGAGAR